MVNYRLLDFMSIRCFSLEHFFCYWRPVVFTPFVQLVCLSGEVRRFFFHLLLLFLPLLSLSFFLLPIQFVLQGNFSIEKLCRIFWLDNTRISADKLFIYYNLFRWILLLIIWSSYVSVILFELNIELIRPEVKSICMDRIHSGNGR